MGARRRITLVETDDGWTAVDEDTGMESREDRCRVLDRLDDAVAVSFDESAGGGADASDDPEIDWFDD
jgi:hypothetical protein